MTSQHDEVVDLKEAGLVAFWRYADFPYLLHGDVSKMRYDGAVYVPSYRSWMKPVLILPPGVGERLARQLEAERVRYSKELARVRVEAEGRLRKIAPDLFDDNGQPRGKTE